MNVFIWPLAVLVDTSHKHQDILSPHRHIEGNQVRQFVILQAGELPERLEKSVLDLTRVTIFGLAGLGLMGGN